MKNEVYVEEALLEVLNETDLSKFQAKLCVDLQLSRLEHFDHVTDDELHLAGLSIPSIRRLRLAIADKKKKLKKSKGLFSTVGKKEGLNMTKVLLATDVIPDALPTTSKNAASTTTCLIAKEEIFLAERLGEGSFAVVKRAMWKRTDGLKMDVAVKILRDASTEIMQDLQQEVNNMQRLQHPNLIRLYGIVFSIPAMMVVEFCDGGALIDRLRSVDKPVLLVSTLLDYSLQIAKGMTYLESKHCVHRDLAARNVLLTDNDRVAKICDFGLMRVLNENERLYTMSAQKKIPFSWCPPESLRYRQFSRSSDVWAFGVTLWELFSYGEEPWSGYRGAEVLSKLEAGERLQRPQRCSAELYDLISTCWSANVDVRPKFSLLKGILAAIKFTIVECRENCIPNNELDLELKTNDRVIVIEGSGVVWYGQNIRTRNFGRFLRSVIHVRNERNDVSPSTMSNAAEQPVAKEPKIEGSEKISKPIPGSFIHAGHGDINPSLNWGQPEKIDDIYLKNPILRKERELKNDEPRRPQFIPSVVSMQASAISHSAQHAAAQMPTEKPLASKRPKPVNENTSTQIADNRTIYSSSNVDPFAPFSEYYYDAFDENAFDSSWEPSQQNNIAFKSSFASSPLHIAYDAPPLEPIRTYQPISLSATQCGKVEQQCVPSRKPEQNGKNENYAEMMNPASVVNCQPAFEKHVPILPDNKNLGAVIPESPALVEKKASVGHPFQLPPPTPVTRPTTQISDANNSKKQTYTAVPRPIHSSPDVQSKKCVERNTVVRSSTISRVSVTDDAHSAPSLNLKTPLGGFSKAPASLSNISTAAVTQSAKTSETFTNEIQRKGSTSTPQMIESGTSKSSTFNGSKYYAASSREAYGEKAESSSQNVASAPQSKIKKDIITSVLRPFNNTNASTTFRETTFAVNLTPSSKNQENKDLVQQSAAVSAKVNLATKSALNSCSTVPTVGKTTTGAKALSALNIDSPDPFEISSSVKNIANRERYSEVFINHSSLPHQPQAVQPASTASFPRKPTVPVAAPPFASSWLPSSSLGLQENRNMPSYGTLPSFSSASLPGSSSAVSFINITAPNVAFQPSSSSVAMKQQNGQLGMLRASPVISTDHSSSITPVLGQNFPNQVLYSTRQQVLTHTDSASIFGSYGTLNSLQQGGGTRNFLSSNLQAPYYWQQGQSPFSSTLTPQPSSSLDTRNGTALVYDANVSNSPRKPQASHRFTGISMNDSHSISNIATNNTENRSSTLVTDEILGLFDPLTTSAAKSTTSVTENQATPVDPVDAVLKEAVFAGREKCAVMLRRCRNNVAKAVRELKIEELLAMGLANDKSVALTALEDCRWDLNAAAAALIT